MSDDSAVEAARRILAIDSDHIDSVDAIAVADAYLSSQSQVERMREALPEFAELARRMAEVAVAGAAQPDMGSRVRAGSRVFALSLLIENGDVEGVRAALTPKDEK